MRLGFFTQPVHPIDRDYRTVIEEDRQAVLLADRLGYEEAFIGEHYTDLAEPITSCLMFIASLAAGESLQVDTGCVVAFDESVQYDVQFAGGIKTGIFGGEGLFLATLQGPGKAIIQTMTLSKLRRELGGGTTGGGEAHGLGSLTNMFGSND